VINVQNALDAYIDSVTDEREPDGKYHPSSMFGCTRQVVYGLRGVEPTEPLDNASKRRFYIGHRLHEAVQRSIETAPHVAEFYPEFAVRDEENNINGHGDGLIMLDTGDVIVLEIKSIKRMAVRYGLPKPEHKKQVVTYAWEVRNVGVWVTDETGNEVFIPPVGEWLRGVKIVYVEKEELQIWEDFLPWTNEWNSIVNERLAELEVYRQDEGALPPRLPLNKDGKKPWNCNYCPFKTKCWRVDPTEIQPKEDPSSEW
jgi:CRISPR/Cas system-associated exonuclease Cas4 (RecB family)